MKSSLPGIKMVKLSTVIIFVALFLSGCAKEEIPEEQVRVDIVNFGSYLAEPVMSDGNSNRKQKGIQLKHHNWETTIKLKKDVVFGFGYKVETTDNPPDSVQIHYFTPVQQAGKTRVTISPVTTRIEKGKTHYALFRMSEEQEMIPGIWRIELRHDDRVLFQKQFLLNE